MPTEFPETLLSSRPRLNWRSLPCVYEDQLSRAVMVATHHPFYIGSAEVQAEQPQPMHWHEAFEIGYVLEGSGLFVLEGQEHTFHPGLVHVISATHRHMAYAFDRACFFNVHFHPDLLRDPAFQTLEDTAHSPFVVGARHFTPLLPIGDGRTEQVIALLRAIEAERRAGGSAWLLMVKGLILQTIALLVRHFISPDPPAAATLRRETILARLAPALQLLEQRLADPPSLKELAAATSLSRYHFGELFREALGSSPVTYRNARRIALARRLLAEGRVPIAHIAEQVGFATVQQFNRVFRQTTGCTPSQYRARMFVSPKSEVRP